MHKSVKYFNYGNYFMNKGVGAEGCDLACKGQSCKVLPCLKMSVSILMCQEMDN